MSIILGSASAKDKRGVVRVAHFPHRGIHSLKLRALYFRKTLKAIVINKPLIFQGTCRALIRAPKREFLKSVKGNSWKEDVEGKRGGISVDNVTMQALPTFHTFPHQPSLGALISQY